MLTSGRVRTWCVRACLSHRRRDRRTGGSPPSLRCWKRARTRGDAFGTAAECRVVEPSRRPNAAFPSETAGRKRPDRFWCRSPPRDDWRASRSLCGRAGSKDPSTNPGVAFGAPKERSLETRIATRLSSLEGIGTRDAGGDLSRQPKMGTSSSKSKKASKSKAAAKRAQDQVTEVDRQVLGLKTQKRKLNAYAKRVEVRPDVPTPAAKRTTRPWPKITKNNQNRSSHHDLVVAGGHRAGDR